MDAFALFLTLLLTLLPVARGSVDTFNWTYMDRMLQRHDRAPPFYPGRPLDIHVGMFLESLGNFRETLMSFDVDIYLYMSWRDDSLRHPGATWTINDDQHRKRIWVPDIYFANARQASFHDVTVPNFNMYVDNDGTIAYSLRTTLSVACALDLHNYPMDHQKCHVRALSYSFTSNILNIRWLRQRPISHNENIALPEFRLTKTSASECDGTYEYAFTARNRSRGRFSCLSADIYLMRSIGHNLLQTFIPLGGIVIVSWTSFFIDRRATPARVTLTFMTLVSLTSLGNGMRFALPQVSYAKAIDFYFFACMLFVFAALIEFALVNSYMRKSEKYEKLAIKYKDKVDPQKILMTSPIIFNAFQKSYDQMMRSRRKSNAAVILDTWRKKSTEWRRQRHRSSSHGLTPENQSPAPRVKFSHSVESYEGRRTDSSEEYSNRDRSASGEGLNGSFYDNVPRLCPQKGSPPPDDAIYPAEGLTEDPEMHPLNDQIGDDVMTASTGSRKESFKQAKKKRDRSMSVAPDAQLSTQYHEFSVVLSRRALNIDKMSRLLFPILFTIVNVVYWTYYLYKREVYA